MIYSQQSKSLFVLRLEDGDDIMASLRKFSRAKRIRGATVEGIGSLKRAKLGYFDFERTREYTWLVLEEDMEVLSLLGNISTKHESYLPHVHVTLGRKDFTVMGGHLDDGSLANMIELVVRKVPGKLVKLPDEKTGLNILKLSQRLPT